MYKTYVGGGLVSVLAITILRLENKFLLMKRGSGKWIFPCVMSEASLITKSVQKELQHDIGLSPKRIHELYKNKLMRFMLCDQWVGYPHPMDCHITKVGWFTCTDMYDLGKQLSERINDNLLYLAYIIQHYEHHPEELQGEWSLCDVDV